MAQECNKFGETWIEGKEMSRDIQICACNSRTFKTNITESKTGLIFTNSSVCLNYPLNSISWFAGFKSFNTFEIADKKK